MSPTFGERLSAIEEQLMHLSVIMDLLLQAAGLMDAEGNWTDLDKPAAG